MAIICTKPHWSITCETVMYLLKEKLWKWGSVIKIKNKRWKNPPYLNILSSAKKMCLISFLKLHLLCIQILPSVHAHQSVWAADRQLNLPQPPAKALQSSVPALSHAEDMQGESPGTEQVPGLQEGPGSTAAVLGPALNRSALLPEKATQRKFRFACQTTA